MLVATKSLYSRAFSSLACLATRSWLWRWWQKVSTLTLALLGKPLAYRVASSFWHNSEGCVVNYFETSHHLHPSPPSAIDSHLAMRMRERGKGCSNVVSILLWGQKEIVKGTEVHCAVQMQSLGGSLLANPRSRSKITLKIGENIQIMKFSGISILHCIQPNFKKFLASGYATEMCPKLFLGHRRRHNEHIQMKLGV